LRCKGVFDETEVTIISQPFHNARALFIANRKGLKAIAFNAKDIPGQYSLKTQARERLARVKMILDLMFGKEPKFYGPHIRIG
jgi:SanA protein